MTRRQPTVCLEAPAKLNLGLFLTGRRADGYHLLESLFWPVTLVDKIELSLGAPPSVECHWAQDCALPGEAIPQGKANLAYSVLQTVPLGGVRIEKRIPMGGGLGGGSSDAGALLRYAWKNRELSEEAALKAAAAIGADVPFFLYGAPAWVRGIGEKIERLSLEKDVASSLHFLLVLLPRPTPTNEVFRAYRESGQAFSSSGEFDVSRPISLGKIHSYLLGARNDLEPAASQVNPLIAEALGELRKIPSVYAGLSGSGSTCFSVFESAASRDAAAKEIEPFLRRRHCSFVRTETYVPSASDNEKRLGEHHGNHRS